MPESRKLDRRCFTLEAALAVLGGVTITLSGCGGGGGSPSSPSAGAGDKQGTVSANHGHVAIVTAAQLSAAGAIVLQIRGTADHPHTVSLSSAELTSIAAGSRVSKTSSVDGGHDHTVSFN